jgi:nitrite reductase (NADH) large subunit
VHTAKATTEILRGSRGRVAGMRLTEGDDLAVDMVVFSAGIRPRDELACAAGLETGERGGVVVDDACVTSDPRIFAIAECALCSGRIWGLVSPGYQMARVVADRILGGDATFIGADMSTKLGLLGTDVAGFGDAFGSAPGAQAITFSDPVSNVYKRLVVGPPVRRSAARSHRSALSWGDLGR